MHKRLISILLAIALLLPSLSGCYSNNKHLNVGVSKITETFSPFFAKEEGDLAVVPPRAQPRRRAPWQGLS